MVFGNSWALIIKMSSKFERSQTVEGGFGHFGYLQDVFGHFRESEDHRSALDFFVNSKMFLSILLNKILSVGCHIHVKRTLTCICVRR